MWQSSSSSITEGISSLCPSRKKCPQFLPETQKFLHYSLHNKLEVSCRNWGKFFSQGTKWRDNLSDTTRWALSHGVCFRLIGRCRFENSKATFMLKQWEKTRNGSRWPVNRMCRFDIKTQPIELKIAGHTWFAVLYNIQWVPKLINRV